MSNADNALEVTAQVLAQPGMVDAARKLKIAIAREKYEALLFSQNLRDVAARSDGSLADKLNALADRSDRRRREIDMEIASMHARLEAS